MKKMMFVGFTKSNLLGAALYDIILNPKSWKLSRPYLRMTSEWKFRIPKQKMIDFLFARP